MSYDLGFQAKVFPLVGQVLVSGLAPLVGSGNVYWMVADEDATYPYIVWQSQDLGGQRADYIGNNGWRGKVTIRVVDTNNLNAYSLLSQVPSLLTITTISGHSFQLTPEHAIPYGPEMFNGVPVFTAALISTIRLI